MLLYVSEDPISGCNPHEVAICELLNRSPLPYQAAFKSACCRELTLVRDRLRVRACWRIGTEDCFAPEQLLCTTLCGKNQSFQPKAMK